MEDNYEALRGNRWLDVKRHRLIASFIVAGGASSRMGHDKGLLELGGVAKQMPKCDNYRVAPPIRGPRAARDRG